MSISVRLDAETEGLLNRLARQRGVTKSEVIRDAIRLIAAGKNGKKPFRPYDAIAHLVGCIHGGPPDLSERTGHTFRELLLKRRPTSHDSH